MKYRLNTTNYHDFATFAVNKLPARSYFIPYPGRAAADAEFGVHSWTDDSGREANDYAASDPVHAEYLGYYREMGMDDAKARAFYALTNSTPFDEVRYLTRDDMARFVTLNCSSLVGRS